MRLSQSLVYEISARLARNISFIKAPPRNTSACAHSGFVILQSRKMEILAFRLVILNALLIVVLFFSFISQSSLEICTFRLPWQGAQPNSRLSDQNAIRPPVNYLEEQSPLSHSGLIKIVTTITHQRRDFSLPTLPLLTLIPGLYPSSTSTASNTASPTTSGSTSSTITASPTTTSANNPLASIVSVLAGNGPQPTSSSGGSNPFQQLGNLLSEGFSGIGNAIIGSLDTPAFFLGIGLGTGAITGLNFSSPDHANAVATQVASANGYSATGMNEIALNVGDGLAATIIPLVDPPDKPLNLSLIIPLAFPFAEGIANGTLVGLHLTTKSFAPSTGDNLTDLAANVALGLSEAFASNIDPNILKNLTGSGLSLSTSGLDFAGIAESAGEGLSLGTVIGLGITQQSIADLAQSPSTFQNFTQMIPVIVKDFTIGLTSSFLESVDFSLLSKKVQGISSSVSIQINIPEIVEGFIRGAVDGVTDGLTVAGGISNFITGKMPVDALARPDAPGTTFNDSVDGAAVAFGRGLANEAILQVGLAIGRKSNSSTPGPLSRRSPIDNLLPSTQGPIINSSFLSFLVQEGVNNLQCKGVGGIGSVAMGLEGSKVLSLDKLGFSNSTTSLLPNTPLTVTLDGNQFTFGLQSVTGSVYINGLPMKTYTYLTVAHGELYYL
jgi:hypothetical protein